MGPAIFVEWIAIVRRVTDLIGQPQWAAERMRSEGWGQSPDPLGVKL